MSRSPLTATAGRPKHDAADLELAEGAGGCGAFCLGPSGLVAVAEHNGQRDVMCHRA